MIIIVPYKSTASSNLLAFPTNSLKQNSSAIFQKSARTIFSKALSPILRRQKIDTQGIGIMADGGSANWKRAYLPEAMQAR